MSPSTLNDTLWSVKSTDDMITKNINHNNAFAYFIGYKYIHIKQSYNVYENNNDVA